jgi:sugar O-acyltransferase (sialic acid O-acetyltransferase NeuD family)
MSPGTPPKTPLIIIGGGGHAREILDIVEAMNLESETFEVLGFAADKYYDEAEMFARHARFLGGVEPVLRDFDARYVIGIGSGDARRDIDSLATANHRQPATLVHPQSSSGFGVELGPGTVIAAGARLTTHISAGRHVHLNVNSTVSHDVTLGDYVTVSPGANVSGRVNIGEAVTLGTGSRIIERLTIGAGTMVGAGATVVSDLPAGVTAIGTPARFAEKPG